MNIPVPAEIKPDPTGTGPLCELCGWTIEDLEELIYLRAADLIAEWERADPRDAWKHNGEQPPRRRPAPAVPPPNGPPQATKDAFWFVVGLSDPERLKAWLADHPRDARFLIKLLESK